jgi:ribosome biogenesis GTPase
VIEIAMEIPAFVREACGHEAAERCAGRVLRVDDTRLLVRTRAGEALREARGRWIHAQQVVPGDWVQLDDEGHAVALVPRRNALSRRAPGRAVAEQLIAANLDAVVIVMALDADFSVRRVERYLLLAHEAGARPIVLLTKALGHPDIAGALAEVRDVARGATVEAIDVPGGLNADAAARCLAAGDTAVLVGSSGVGKSTLLNHLLGGSQLATQPVRERDGKGRHTTTWRELHYLPGGAAVIDTPGMREVQLWAGTEALEATFDDLAELAAACRFRDCRHGREPGCALQEALAQGRISEERLRSFCRLHAELLERPRAPRPNTGRVQARALRARLADKRGKD